MLWGDVCNLIFFLGGGGDVCVCVQNVIVQCAWKVISLNISVISGNEWK